MSYTKRFMECDNCGEINWHALESEEVHTQVDKKHEELLIDFECKRCGIHNIRRLKIREA